MNPSRRALLGGGIVLVSARLLAPARALAAAPVEVVLDPTFAWLAALARAAGFEEYAGIGSPAWTATLDALRPRLSGLPAVAALRSLRRLGISFDAVPRLAVHLRGEPGALEFAVPLDPRPEALDERWPASVLPRFLQQVNQAAKRVRFGEVWAAHTAELEPIRAALAAEIAPFDLAWMETWFGYPAPGRVQAVPGLVEWPANYGPRRAGIDPAFTAVLGVDLRDGTPRFAEAIPLLTHEIGHSFVGPTLKANRDLFSSPGERLFGAVRERMKLNHYGDWETVVEESVLRAFVVRYLAAHGGPAAARAEVGVQIDAGFPWVLVLADTLERYEADRARFPTFGDFATELAAVLTVIAGEEEDRAAKRPRLLRTEPDLTSPVDAGSARLVLTFDRPMADRSWAFVGDPDEMPTFGTPVYDAERRVLTVDWQLGPGRTYRFGLNAPRYRGFRSADGVPLDPVVMRFTTR